MSNTRQNLCLSFDSALLCIICLTGCSTTKCVEVSFAKNMWSQDNWTMVKSPRWAYIGKWDQQEDHIVNVYPTDATPDEMLGKRAHETFTSMIWNETLSGDFTVSATMSFDYQMAPLITLSGPIGTDASGYPELREHWEIVLFDKGLNVWHHMYSNGKPSWKKVASTVLDYKAPATFLPAQKYEMTVKVYHDETGTPWVNVSCGASVINAPLPELPENVLVGLTACEGVNRFYDFKISK